jgi:iron complex transport system ATP-binding protein
MLDLKNCHIGKGATLYTIDHTSVEAGKLSVLIGANGAGKSTLLDAIALGNSCGGTISYGEKLLSQLTIVQRSRYIALVESRFSGAEYLSTQEYLELGRFPHTGFHGRLDHNDKAIVSTIAHQLKLEHLLGQSTLTLSDGERQRAGIARALIQETPIILLDEPTSFLDYPNKRAIMSMLRSIAEKEQKVILLASHDLELCLEFCDDFLVINPRTKKLEHYSAADLTLDKLIETAFETTV